MKLPQYSVPQAEVMDDKDEAVDVCVVTSVVVESVVAIELLVTMLVDSAVVVLAIIALEVLIDVRLELAAVTVALLKAVDVAVAMGVAACDPEGNIWAVTRPRPPATTTASTMPVRRRFLKIMQDDLFLLLRL
jgi:hypothetical protein